MVSKVVNPMSTGIDRMLQSTLKTRTLLVNWRLTSTQKDGSSMSFELIREVFPTTSSATSMISIRKAIQVLKQDKYQDRYLDAIDLFNNGYVDKALDKLESIPGVGDLSLSGRIDGQNMNQLNKLIHNTHI